jgi:hypothetical protein
MLELRNQKKIQILIERKEENSDEMKKPKKNPFIMGKT